MRTNLVEMAPPALDDPPGVVQAGEPAFVQALVAEVAVETLDLAVLGGLPQPDEVQLHVTVIGPGIECLAGELRAIVADDQLWRAALDDELLEDARDTRRRSRCRRRGPPRPLVRQRARPRDPLRWPLSPAGVMPARSREAEGAARTAQAQRELRHHEAHGLPIGGGLHHFFRSTALAAFKSRLRSATICFSRPCSTSGSFSRLASGTSIPPHFDFQR